MPIHHHLSGSTSQYCSNHLLGSFFHIMAHVCIAVHHVWWHSWSNIISQRVFYILCLFQYVLHTAESQWYLCIVPLFAKRVSRFKSSYDCHKITLKSTSMDCSKIIVTVISKKDMGIAWQFPCCSYHMDPLYTVGNKTIWMFRSFGLCIEFIFWLNG